MRSREQYEAALKLIADGLNDCEIERSTGIPRRTIFDWRHGLRRTVAQRAPMCALCDRPGYDFAALPSASYSYLLGLYLGDGWLTEQKPGIWKLRIACFLGYPQLLLWCENAMRAVLPNNRPHMYRPDRTSLAVEVNIHSKHLICLFPQHGPGPKHLRKIELANWQARVVAGEPEQFLRGLIHSDGSRFMNRVQVSGKRYEYPRYNFTSASDDIRGLFTATCDQLGIEWRRMNARNISVARRASVARLDEFVGPKG
jgi:hypothetical protein